MRVRDSGHRKVSGVCINQCVFKVGYIRGRPSVPPKILLRNGLDKNDSNNGNEHVQMQSYVGNM